MPHQELSPLFRALLLADRDIRYRLQHVNQNYTLLHAQANRLGAFTPAMTKQHRTHP